MRRARIRSTGGPFVREQPARYIAVRSRLSSVGALPEKERVGPPSGKGKPAAGSPSGASLRRELGLVRLLARTPHELPGLEVLDPFHLLLSLHHPMDRPGTAYTLRLGVPVPPRGFLGPPGA